MAETVACGRSASCGKSATTAENRPKFRAAASKSVSLFTTSDFAFVSEGPTLDDLLWATVHQIALMLKVRVVVLLPEDGGLVVKAGFPPEDMLDEDANAGRARPAIARPDTVEDRRGRSAL